MWYLGTISILKGYTLFLCKEHKTELFDLAPDRKLAFLEEMSLVAEAAAKAFGAEKMNYELLETAILIFTGIYFPGFPGIWEILESGKRSGMVVSNGANVCG